MIGVTVHESNDLLSTRSVPSTAIYLLGGILREEGQDISIIDPNDSRSFYPLYNHIIRGKTK